MQTTIENTTAQTSAPVIIGKFPGMLGAFQLNCFNTLLAAGISRKVAHKVSVDYGSDLGNLMKSDPDVAQKIGKAKDNGESSLRITAASKVRTSRAMSVMRVAQVIGDLYKEALLADRKVENLSAGLTEYVSECEAWADKQTFTDK